MAVTTSSPAPPPVPPPEPWPPLWARKVGFFFGLGVSTWEILLDDLAHMWLLGFAFIFTGLPIARGVEKIVDLLLSLRGGSGGTPPP